MFKSKFKIFTLYSVVIFSLLFCLFSCKSATDSSSGYSDLFQMSGDPDYVSPNNVSIADATNQSTSLSADWWKDTAFYHVWVKSFKDSSFDTETACGDLQGIKEKLDYIKTTLGCDAIWLSPIFECSYKGYSNSDNMHGYDTTDYYSVNSYFGNETALTNLITACHEKGIKIIFDFVPNHTSSNHQWFIDSANGTNGKTDWYLWSDTKLSWNPMGGTDTWSKSDVNNKYYYCPFWSGMPDLNYRNYEVREEMKNVVRYWLNKGFDGLRIDAARYLIEDANNYADTEGTHTWFQELQSEVLSQYSSPKFMVCESWIENNRTALDSYFGTSANPEFNMVFDFDAGRPCINSVNRTNASYVRNTLRSNPTDYTGEAYGTFLGNHDEYAGRFGTTLSGDTPRILQTTALSLLRPTVPFIYYGNELGQLEGSISGDIRLRQQFDWTTEGSQASSSTSPLKLNSAILSLRKTYSALRRGTITKLTSLTTSPQTTANSLAYIISDGTDTFLAVYNINNSAVSQLKFSGCSGIISDSATSSLLIGDTSSTALSVSSGTATVTNLAPYSFRLYYIGDNSKSNVFDSETYTAGEIHTIPVITSTSMYLRGSMNSWGGTSMTVDTSTGDEIWSCTVSLSASTTYTFKFCINTSSSWGTNWGLGSGSSLVKEGTNISYATSTAGNYKFYFNETKSTYSVEKQ